MSRYGVNWTPGAAPGKSIDMAFKMQRVAQTVSEAISITAPATTDKPDLFPFPWEDALPRINTGEDGEWATFYNNAAHDAVALKVNVVADPASLAVASYYTGFTPIGWGGAPIQVAGGVYRTDETGYAPEVSLDLWAYSNYWSVTNVLARYTETDTVWGGIVPPGERTYAGVASVNPWSFGAYFEATDVGKPVLFEIWFDDNPAKTSATTTFNGYTLFGDQGNCCFTGIGKLGNAGEFVNKYVSGILKAAADSTNPQISDIMFGVMYTGTAVGGTGVIVVNGQITKTGTLSAAATDVGGYMDTAFAMDAAKLGGYAGAADFLQLWVSDATYTYPEPPGSFMDLSDSAAYPDNPLNYDTKAVKFVNYIDRTSGLAEGTPTGQTVWCSWPMMYTHPGWPVVAPAPSVSVVAAEPLLKTMRVRVELS